MDPAGMRWPEIVTSCSAILPSPYAGPLSGLTPDDYPPPTGHLVRPPARTLIPARSNGLDRFPWPRASWKIAAGVPLGDVQKVFTDGATGGSRVSCPG